MAEFVFRKVIAAELLKKYSSFIWNLQVPLRVQKNQLLVPILSQMKP
jgi:hypothetical protein